MVDLPNESDKATRQIESSNIYDQVASFDSIANAQTDMICHYDEVVYRFLIRGVSEGDETKVGVHNKDWNFRKIGHFRNFEK